MKRKLILTDVDGVVLQWGKTFGQYIKDMGLVPETHNIRPAYKVEKLLNITKDEAIVLIDEFHHSDHFKNLIPYHDALVYIHALAQKGYRFIAITACGDSNNKIIYNNRYKNLNKYFLNIFEDLHIMSLRASKAEYLSRYKNAYWIEDTLKNAITGLEFGHSTFFINRGEDTRNQGSHPSITEFSSWKEIYTQLTKF